MDSFQSTEDLPTGSLPYTIRADLAFHPRAAVTGSLSSFFERYAVCYVGGDADSVADMSEVPFTAVSSGRRSTSGRAALTLART